MKALATILFAALTFIGFASFSSTPFEGPNPQVTLIAEDGVTRTIDLWDMKVFDWKNETISQVEFREGESLIKMEGSIIYTPEDGNDRILQFKDEATLTQNFLQIQKDFKESHIRRIIFDNLKLTASKKSISPLLYFYKVKN